MNVPHGFRAAAALGAAALSMAPVSLAAQPIEVEEADSTGRLPGRPAAALGVFSGLVGFSDDVEIGNSYYDDQVPGLGMLFGLRGGVALTCWATSRLDVEGEARLALSRTDAGGPREAGSASVLGWRAHALVEVLTDEPVHPFLLAGLGAETLIDGTEFMAVPDTDLVLHGGVGGLVPIGRRSAIRADLRLEMMAGRDGGAAAAFEAQIGYSIRFGGPGPRIGRIQVASAARPRPAFVHVARPAPPDPEPLAVPRDPDADGDRVLAADDRCPEQAETVNGFADADGCADEIPADLAARVGELADVRFKRGTIRLDRRSRPVLDQLSAVLLRYPDVRIELGAHTDATGSPSRELEISQQQAAYVKWYLVDKGIDERRIDAVGYGSQEMKYDHATRAGRAANWRIELELVSGQPAQPAAEPEPPPRKDGPAPVWLPAIPRPHWLSPYARAEFPLFGPRPVWLAPPH